LTIGRKIYFRCLSYGDEMRSSENLMKPLKLAKAIALSFTLGAILSVGSDPKLTHQAEAMALAQAQAIATSAVQKVGSTLGHWLEHALKRV
jgi:hypothetical protein